MTRLFIHAGFSETGTTAIQASLRAGADALKRQGYSYPPAAGLDGVLMEETAGNGVFLQRYAFYPRKPGMEKTARDFLSRRVAGDGPGAAIISNESIIDALPLGFRALQALFGEQGIEPVYVVGVREPAAHAVSVYRQLVRMHGETRTLPEFLESGSFDPAGRLERLGGVVGRGAMRVYAYSADPAENLARFLGAIDPALSLSAPASPPAYPSLGGLETELMRYLNLRGTDPAVARRVADVLVAGDMPHEAPDEEIALAATLQAELRRQTAALNEWLVDDLPPPPLSNAVSRFEASGLPPGARRLARALADLAAENLDLRSSSNPTRFWRHLKAERNPLAALRSYLASLRGS